MTKWRVVTEAEVDLNFEEAYFLGPNGHPLDKNLSWEEFEPDFLTIVLLTAKEAGHGGDLSGLVFFGFDEGWNATAVTDDPAFIEHVIGQIPYITTEDTLLQDKASVCIESAD